MNPRPPANRNATSVAESRYPYPSRTGSGGNANGEKVPGGCEDPTGAIGVNSPASPGSTRGPCVTTGMHPDAQVSNNPRTAALERIRPIPVRRAHSPLVAFMTSGPCMTMVVEKADAVAALGTAIGTTDPAQADAGTVRKLYAESEERNAIQPVLRCTAFCGIFCVTEPPPALHAAENAGTQSKPRGKHQPPGLQAVETRRNAPSTGPSCRRNRRYTTPTGGACAGNRRNNTTHRPCTHWKPPEQHPPPSLHRLAARRNAPACHR